jgi:diacylglycerol kinase (ATP)
MKPDSGYISLIINTCSGARSNKPVVNKFIEYLRQKNFRTKIDYTESLVHARELAADAAVKYDCALVVVAGGDGTIREVTEGLEGSDKPLMIIPSGTENLLANELGCKSSLKSAISTFEASISRPLDLCKVNDMFFMCVGGVGFDGEVVNLVSDQRRGNITQLHYFWPIWKTFWRYRFPPLTVEVDDKVIFAGRGIVIFGNISRYALGLPILLKADFSDGLLDVCVCHCPNRFSLLYHALLTVLKMRQISKGVIYRQCQKLKIYSDTKIPTEIDGDPGPDLPLEISIIPKAVKVLVPPKSKPIGMRRRIFKLFK